MKGMSRLLSACVLSLVVALGLNVFQQTNRTDADGTVMSVFGSRPKRLTDANLVDRLVPLPLQLSIAKVEWHEPTLSVDLSVKPDSSPGAVYEDLLQLARLGFRQTSNVDQLLIRVMEQSSSQPSELLMTMDARRDRFLEQDSKSRAGRTTDAKALLQTNTNMTYSLSWRDRFGG